LKDVPFSKAWETVHQMSFDNKRLIDRSPISDEDALYEDPDIGDTPDNPSLQYPVIWITKDPAPGQSIGIVIFYLKSKWLKLGILRYPDDKTRWRKRGKYRTKGFDYVKSIVIDDVIGFFQSSFLAAMDGMKGAITVTAEEQALIDWGKPLRGDFSNQPMEKIAEYNRTEIRILTRMMEAFRKALASLGLQPRHWYGPGAIAKEELERRGITSPKKEKAGHYPTWLSAHKPSAAQDWSHYAFSGGRIDLIQQGVHADPDKPIYEYDICSAYPAVIKQLPSMRGGKYKKHKAQSFTLEEFKAFASQMNMLSMFEVRWNFHEDGAVPQGDRETLEVCEQVFADNPRASPEEIDAIASRIMQERTRIPFYPLFYRCNGTEYHAKGTILYPEHGQGRYYRDELLAAIAWCEKFPRAVISFEFKGAMEFLPVLSDPADKSSYDRPFEFVQGLFDRRAAIVAGTKQKATQWRKTFGEPHMPPRPAAGKELKEWLKRLDEVAELHGGPVPYDILEKALKLIMNSLYGKMAQSIGSVGELPKSSNPFYAGVITSATRAVLLQAALKNPQNIVFLATDAIMSVGPLEGLETTREKKLGAWEFAQELDVQEGAVFLHPGIYSFHDLKAGEHTKTRGFKIDLPRNFLMRDVLDGWRKGTAKLPMPANVFMTLGMAVSSKENWKKCGSWKAQNRDLDLNKSGAKRVPCSDRLRAKQLVFNAPASNFEIGQLSAPYYPDWLDEDGLHDHQDEVEVGFKFGGLNEDIADMETL
jgi:hypothetical protein